MRGSCLCGKVRLDIAGSFERPSGLRLVKHTFVGDKGDYYDITDGVPQSDSY